MIFANQREAGFVDKHLNVNLVEKTCLNTCEANIIIRGLVVVNTVSM